MQGEVFYIYHQGEQRGPYTMKQINHMYRASFIDDETLYWREGMEQWQPVTEIVQRRKRRNRLVNWVLLLGIAAGVGLLIWFFGPVTLNAWREMTSGDYTQQSAWWRARGIVRAQLAKGEHVQFDPFGDATVKLHDQHAATVELGGTVQSKGSPERRAWRVRLQYDPLKGKWSPSP